MCQIQERIYVGADGTRQRFEQPYPCSRALSPKKLCSNVTRKTVEYHSQSGRRARDDCSTPSSTNPPTPTGSATYLVQERRPSSSSRTTSSKDSVRVINPTEFVIEFGKKDKSKRYRSSKRSSLSAVSVGSNDGVVESAGSENSYTHRTGLPEVSIMSSNNHGYNIRSAAPQGHQRNASDTSVVSSTTPSLYAPSEAESSSRKRVPKHPTLVHNPPATTTQPPSSPRVDTPPSPYRVTIHVPKRPDDVPASKKPNTDRHDSGSSNASASRAAAPEITDRDADRARRREERRRQEEADRNVAEQMMADNEREAGTRVRFNLDSEKEKEKAKEDRRRRAEAEYLQAQRRKDEDRAYARGRRQRDREEGDARRASRKEDERRRAEIARKEKEIKEAEARQRSRRGPPPTREFNLPGYTKRPGSSRRNSVSMSQEDVIERNRLLAETDKHMQRELEATAQREQEELAVERANLLREQQQTTRYYDPRGGDRNIPAPGIGRRGSVSGRRNSIVAPPPSGLIRMNSQRRSSVVHQDRSPATEVAQPNYYARPPSSHGTSAVYAPSNSSQTYNRSPSARYPAYGNENPFAQPPTHLPHTSSVNPFTPAYSQPQSLVTADPWSTANMRDALPATQHAIHEPVRHAPPTLPPRQGTRRRQVVVDQTSSRQATRNMGKAVGYDDDYEDSDDDDIDPYRPQLGRGASRKQKR